SGEITELPIKEGDYVEQGDLLVRIKPDIYKARIDELNASLLTQKARREQARASLLEVESIFKQKKKLIDRGAISEAEFIQANSDYKSQQANFEASKYQVQSVQAQLQQAKEELQKTIIRAPRRGTISKLAVEAGERVLGNTQAIGTELLRIAKMDQMEVQVEVNENDIVNVASGDTTNIMVDAYPERTFKGIVTEIANSADVSAEGTSEEVTNYEVKIRIATPHNMDMGEGQLVQPVPQEAPEDTFIPAFKPGMSATVDIETNTVHNVVAIPIQAVTVRDFAKDEKNPEGNKSDSTGTEAQKDTASAEDDFQVAPREDLRKVVFVVEAGEASRRAVETGISDNTHIQLSSGVEEGEEIVIGSYRVLSKELADGDKINVNNQQFSR